LIRSLCSKEVGYTGELLAFDLYAMRVRIDGGREVLIFKGPGVAVEGL
jgi:hypothetical protein